MTSIFTRIIDGELPGRFVWRDDVCVAFLSIAPTAAGHTLVVPIEEVDHWIDLDPATAGHLMAVARAIGRAQHAAFHPARVGLIIAGHGGAPLPPPRHPDRRRGRPPLRQRRPRCRPEALDAAADGAPRRDRQRRAHRSAADDLNASSRMRTNTATPSLRLIWAMPSRLDRPGGRCTASTGPRLG